MSKRKANDADASTCKKAKGEPVTLPIHRDLLNLFYPHCTSLRKYILASLPQTSRLRKRKIESIRDAAECGALERQLSHLLDTTLVCYHQLARAASDQRWEQWLSFSQKGDDSHVSLTLSSPIYSQSEVKSHVVQSPYFS